LSPRRHGSSRTTRQPISHASHENSHSFRNDAPTLPAIHKVNNKLNDSDPPYGADRHGTAKGCNTRLSTSRSSDSTVAAVCYEDADKMEIEEDEEELVSPRTRPKGTKSTQAVLLNFPSNERNVRNNNINTRSLQSASNQSLSSNCSEEPSLYGAQFLSPSVRVICQLSHLVL
jgi:hypothetical protein